MNLDVHTLFVANLSTSFIVAILMLVIWRTQDACSSLGWIFLSFVCLIVSDLLITFSASVPDFISAVIANTIYLLWVIFLWQAARDFQGLIFPIKSVLLSSLFFIGLFSYYRYIKFDASMQIVVFSAFVLVYSLLTIVVFLKPIHSRWPATEYKFTIFIVLLFVIVTMLRISNAVIEKISHELMNQAFLHQLSILSSGLYSVAFALGFLWILQRHLAKQITMREDSLKAAYVITDKLREEAEKASLHDPLTSAGNRRKFVLNADLERERHLRHKHPLCLAFIDIDHFKIINDRYGHELGDQMLIKLVAHCTDIIRNIDMVYRWGGEEFIILFPETSLSRAILVCERIREDIEKNMRVEQHGVTISFGVTQLRGAESIQTMVQRADDLLYKAKQSGRNCVVSE